MSAGKPDRKLQAALDDIQARLREMHNYTERVCNQLRMAREAQAAADQSYRKVVCAKYLIFFPRHSVEEREFLAMMVRLALACAPDLADESDEVARYYCANYGYEWFTSRITATARTEARDIILGHHDPSLIDEDLAAAVAYVRCHHKTLKFSNIGDTAETVEWAKSMLDAGYFADRCQDWREELRLDELNEPD